MVVSYQLVEEVKLSVGHFQIVVRHVRQRLFKISHHVVCEISHKSARQLRSVRELRRFVFLDYLVEESYRVFYFKVLLAAVLALYYSFVVVQRYLFFRFYSDVRISAPLVFVVYRFEYEAIFIQLVQTVEKVYRRERVDEYLVKSRYVLVLAQQFFYLFDIWIQHIDDLHLIISGSKIGKSAKFFFEIKKGLNAHSSYAMGR